MYKRQVATQSTQPNIRIKSNGGGIGLQPSWACKVYLLTGYIVGCNPIHPAQQSPDTDSLCLLGLAVVVEALYEATPLSTLLPLLADVFWHGGFTPSWLAV